MKAEVRDRFEELERRLDALEGRAMVSEVRAAPPLYIEEPPTPEPPLSERLRPLNDRVQSSCIGTYVGHIGDDFYYAPDDEGGDLLRADRAFVNHYWTLLPAPEPLPLRLRVNPLDPKRNRVRRKSTGEIATVTGMSPGWIVCRYNGKSDNTGTTEGEFDNTFEPDGWE